MTLKMKNISFIIGMIILFFSLWGVSLFADISDGFTGFGEKIDISPNDKNIVFSHYNNGDASLYIVPASGGDAKVLAEPEEGYSYINPVFSPDGEKIAFIKQWEEDEQPFGELMIIDLKNKKIESLTDEGNHMTDAAFSPDGIELFVLQSSTYENYSPIAAEHPHGFDIYRIDMNTKKIEQVTNEDAYQMSNLAVTPDGEQLMYHSYRDDDVLVFYSLEDKKETVISPKGPNLKRPIFSSPSLSADGKNVAFSGVAGEDSTFIYEGFVMELNKKKAEQVTSFNEHVTSPVFFNHQNKLLVTVDKNFAAGDPEYSYWVIDIDEDSRQWLDVQVPESDES